jgi:hypothetical protein
MMKKELSTIVRPSPYYTLPMRIPGNPREVSYGFS